MKQEDKELLIRDLSARLQYGVKVQIDLQSDTYPLITCKVVNVECTDPTSAFVGVETPHDTYEEVREFLCKPYLFPLSSMTEEQTEEVHNLIYHGVSESVDETSKWLKTRKENELRPITLTYISSYKLVIDWFCKNHFDYRGLIEKGLALDATNLNIY